MTKTNDEILTVLPEGRTRKWVKRVRGFPNPLVLEQAKVVDMNGYGLAVTPKLNDDLSLSCGSAR